MKKNSDTGTADPAPWSATIPSSGSGIETFSIPHHTMGPPDTRNQLTILTKFQDDTRCPLTRKTDTEIRPFKVAVRLEKSHNFEYEQGLLVTKGYGSSFITGNDGFSDLQFTVGDVIFQLTKNSKSEYSFLEIVLNAIDLNSVHEYFYAWVIPILDELSYKSGTPLFLGAIRIDDMKNDIIYLENRSPYSYFHADITEITYFPELKQIKAMYREATNSSSDFYRFFCLYKILEGMFDSVKPAIARMLRNCKVPFDKIKDVVPAHNLIPDEYKPYVGKSVKQFFDMF